MELKLRHLRASDREPIAQLLARTAVFRPDEIDVAMEVVDGALEKGEGSGYTVSVADVDGTPAGYACWGAAPCTVGTFDLYWIATDPSRQGRGVGRALMEAAEKDMRARGGRLCVIETSSLPQYEATRRFYLSLGYALAAQIQDFYLPGDDKVVFTRFL